MGLFGKKKPTNLGAPRAKTRNPYRLRSGTQVPVTGISDLTAKWARETFERKPKLGHVFTVEVHLVGQDIVAIYQDKQVAIMHPDFKRYYIEDMRILSGRGQYGLTELAVKPVGAKSPHALLLNWGSGAAYDGGLL
jgi:hypothetical protein